MGVTEQTEILIVEDRAVMRAMLREFLQSEFATCGISEAGTGRRALELVHERRPAVVLMDIELPDVSGIDLTAQIRALAPETRVIVVSQHSAQPYVERAHAAGAYAFLAKDRIYIGLVPLVARAVRGAPPPNGSDS